MAETALAGRLPNNPGAAAVVVCGVLRIGAVRVALPIEVLREVIPCPTSFDGLLAAAPGLLGAVRLRGRVVPVVDLRGALGLPVPHDVDGDEQVIALMRHGGRTLGLLANAVCGLTSLDPARLGVMEKSVGGGDGGGALLFTGSFERTDGDGGAVSLLDPAAVMRLPGLPLLRDVGDGAAATGAIHATDRPVLLVRCGDIGLALEVGDVHATLPGVTLLPSSLDGGLCRGVIEHAGLRIPAVDALALLELGSLAPGEPCQALLLRFGEGQVALLVSRVVDIVRLPVDDLAPLSPLAVQRLDCFGGSVRIAGHGQHLLLAEGALGRTASLRALASLNTRAPEGPAAVARGGSPARSAADAAGAPGTEVITYDVGREAATPLDQLIEVLACPVEILRPARAHPAAVGLVTHQGRGITLLCLRALLDGGPAATLPQPDSARVLVVESAGVRFGFVVPAVSHIDRALWERHPATADDRQKRAGTAAGQSLVEVQGNGQRRTLRLVDLQALARSLAPGPPAATAATAATGATRRDASVALA